MRSIEKSHQKWSQHILVPSVIFIFSRDLIFHGLNILRGRGKSRIDPGSEDGLNRDLLANPCSQMGNTRTETGKVKIIGAFFVVKNRILS